MKRQAVRSNELQYARVSGKDSDESGEENELIVWKTRKVYKESPTVEKIIEEGDTLQSLSIRYQCPIAELKRLNHIHKENEIFARTKIKLPARPFSMGIAGVHDSGNSSPNGQLPVNVIDKDVLHKKLISTASSSDEKLDFNKAIFNSNIVNKTCDIADANPPSSEDEAEDVRLLPPVPEIATSVKRGCSGADADISWIALIVCIVIVIFAIPVVYTLYIFEHPQEFHQKHPQDDS